MWRIRTTKTNSKKNAVQVVSYHKGKTSVVKHIGSGLTNEELASLRRLAENYINQNDPVLRLPLAPPETKASASPLGHLVTVENLKITNSYHLFAYEFYRAFYSFNGFDGLNNGLLRDLVLMRMAEPASKLRSIELLQKYFGIAYSKNTVYKNISKFKKFKDRAEEIAVSYAKKHLNFDFSLVFYDVTTLYFETFQSDVDKKDSEGNTVSGLRKCGFSKDGKSNQPQILIALVVNDDGYPIATQVFTGNKFEGHTFLPVILSLKEKYGIKDLTVVADAGVLSKDNMEELASQGLSYIVGARLSNLKPKLMEQVSREIKDKPGAYFKTEMEGGLGYLICDFSPLRALKDKSDRKKQLAKAQNQIDDPGKYLKRSRFVQETTKSVYRLNERLIAEDELRDGIKGYYTNLEVVESNLIVSRYHDLWKIEKAFRIAKSDLLARPVFHRKRESVEAHVLIVFVSLCVIKSMEITMKMSAQKIHDLIWDTLDIKFEDSLTGEGFNKRMVNIPEKAREILGEISGRTY